MEIPDNNTPRSSLPPQFRELKRVALRIGGIEVSREHVMMDTVLGSCIAACLYDPVAEIGGMNHFMLPESLDSQNPTSARYGVYAMELLINELMKIGGKRQWFEAKIFGGGHVLKVRESLEGVPQRNIDFVRNFLLTENIPIVKEDVGGYQPRRILFDSKTGKVSLRRMNFNETGKTVDEEIQYLNRLKSINLDGDTTLF